MYHHHHKVLLQKEHNFWLYKLIMIPDVDIFEFIPEMTTIFEKTNQCVINYKESQDEVVYTNSLPYIT